jgi:hypothetical protein
VTRALPLNAVIWHSPYRFVGPYFRAGVVTGLLRGGGILLLWYDRVVLLKSIKDHDS